MSGHYGKIFGAIIGYAMAHLDGAIAGLLIGGFLDEYFIGSSSQKEHDYIRSDYGGAVSGDFHMSLLALSAVVMQSDGQTTRSELDYVKSFFVKQFGVERTKQDMLVLREMIKRNVPLEKVCLPLRQRMGYQGRLQLLHYLFGVAHADGVLSGSERQLLSRIALLLGISPLDVRSIAAMFAGGGMGNSDRAYEILGISSDATDEDVKKAYRRMAVENHPDKVTHLGEDLLKDAEEKFKKIQEAYDEIKKRRGFS